MRDTIAAIGAAVFIAGGAVIYAAAAAAVRIATVVAGIYVAKLLGLL